MKPWMMISKLQRYTFLATTPLIIIILNYIIYNREIFSNYKIWLYSFPIMWLLGFLAWLTSLLMGNWLKHKFRELRQLQTRLLFQILFVLTFSSLCIFGLFWIYDSIGLLGYQWDWNTIKLGWLVGLSLNFLIETLYEADYAFLRYKESVEERGNLEKMAVHQEFDTLKNLVNPHFLFNCFNTLSSLIEEDREKAGQFLNELSKVYRYLLRNNQEVLSTLDSEIGFIRSYYQLLKTRYGDALELNIDVDSKYGKYLLPSLSLQLLVENAVKHNVIATDRPLVIDIFTTEGNRLIVNNNLQRKLVKVNSNRVGLENIRSKYALLHQQGFQLIEDEKNYTVVMPLIWNNSQFNKHILVKNQKN